MSNDPFICCPVIQRTLEKCNVIFPDGASAILSSDSAYFYIRHWPASLDTIERRFGLKPGPAQPSPTPNKHHDNNLQSNGLLLAEEPARGETKAMVKARKEIRATYERVVRHPEDKKTIESFTVETAIKGILSDKNFDTLFHIRFWAADNQQLIIPHLINLIDNPKEVGLTNSADVIIWDRIQKGDLEYWGHGWVVPDDIFTVSGRASWLLRDITGEDFGSVSMKTTADQRKELQTKWSSWWKKVSK